MWHVFYYVTKNDIEVKLLEKMKNNRTEEVMSKC